MFWIIKVESFEISNPDSVKVKPLASDNFATLSVPSLYKSIFFNNFELMKNIK